MSTHSTQAPTQHLSTAPAKLLGLEVIRCISAIAVLFWHYQHFWYVGEAPTEFDPASQPLHDVFRLFYEQGHLGVQVFWCISGYIFFWKYRDSIADKRLGLREFLVLRVSRLYPLHLLTFALVAVLQAAYITNHPHFFVYQHNDAYHALLQLFLASDWGLQAGYSFNGPIWSISLEIIVYALFFALLRLAGKRTMWVLAIIALAALAIALRLRHPVFLCTLCFFAGGLAAIGAGSDLARRQGRGLSLLALSLLILVPLLWTQVLGRSGFGVPLLVSMTPILLYLMAQPWPVPAGLQGLIETAGNVTYASYLLHFPVQLLIILAYSALGLAVPKESVGFLAAFMFGVLALSVWTFRAFEMPCQRWLRLRLAPARPAER